ncbi:MAG: O-antigen ligase family protein [Cyanobacteria bacterium P01_D01_bin.123]
MVSGRTSPAPDLPLQLAIASLAILPIAFFFSALLLLTSGFLNLRQRGWQGGDRRLYQLLSLQAIAILAVTATHNTASSWLGMFNYLPFLGYFVLITQFLSRSERIRPCLQAIVTSSLPVSLLGLGQAIWGWEGRLELIPIVSVIKLRFISGRPTSVFSSPNHLAVYLVIVGAIAWGLWMARPKQLCVETVVQVVAFGIALPLLILTTSRNGWLIGLLGVFLALIIERRWRWTFGAILACLLPVGAALGFPGLRAIVPAAIWQRLIDSFVPGTLAHIAAVTRWELWQLAWQLSLERPLTGWGWQSFGQIYQSQVPPPREALTHAHNLLLNIAAGGGWALAILFLIIWGWIWLGGWQAWYRWRLQHPGIEYPILGICLALTCYFSSGFMDAVYLDGRLNVLIWTTLSCVRGFSYMNLVDHQGTSDCTA